MAHIKKILVMESGSFKTFGGAAKATYDIYRYLKNCRAYDVDLYGDFSKIDAGAKRSGVKELKEKAYDAVLINSIRDVPVIKSYLVGQRSGKARFIYTDRGNVLLNFRNARLGRLLPKMLLRQHFMHEMRKWLGVYIAISAEQQEYAKGFFTQDTKVEYLPIAPARNFVRMRRVHKEEWALYIGRLDERQKKVGFLINGIKRVAELYPGSKRHVLLKIVGSGPDGERYKKQAEGLGLGGNIAFAGFAEEKELARIYNRAKFFVSASEWEGMSRTFVEAMACRLPLLVNERNNTVVGYDPVRRMVDEGYNGLVYAYGDLDDFAEKFYFIYSDRKKRAELAENAFLYGKQFNLRKNLMGYRKIIEANGKKA